MEFSKFGRKFTRYTGARRLMDDLGEALAGSGDMLMLGGGNPAHIPEVQAVFRERMQRILANGREFERMIGNYDAPQGERDFVHALAQLLHRTYGWPIGPRNIALTSGSQSGFFMLFNLLAGEFEDGSEKSILLPVTPEYIGYADLGLSEHFFRARRPSIEFLDRQMFKYHVDFKGIDADASIAALCVSRPTNPTGNVLTDTEIDQLAGLARAHGVPLIIDNAYGAPFPNIIFSSVTPIWDDNIVLCMSLSKLGLPALRTGIVIANEEIIDALTAMNAILHLATSSVGAVLSLEMVRSGEIIDMSRGLITPYYRQRAEDAVAWVHEACRGLDYYIHKPEGAIFLWIWFRDLPISSAELYERLKKRGVLILSGHYFFPGLSGEWRHTHECVRVTYAQQPQIVKRGIALLAEEARRAYR